MQTRAGETSGDWREDLRHARRDSQSFYRDLLGWAWLPDRGHGEACELSAEGRMRIRCGSVALPEKWGESGAMRQCWVRVEDVEATVARAVELGARVRMAPLRVEGVGHVATLVDPMGTLVSLIQHAA